MKQIHGFRIRTKRCHCPEPFRLLLAALALIFCGHGAKAEKLDGNELFELCGELHDFNREVCVGITIGLVEGMAYAVAHIGLSINENALQGSASPLRVIGICKPASVSYAQLDAILRKQLIEYPEHRHLMASGLAHVAWAKAFPCDGLD